MFPVHELLDDSIRYIYRCLDSNAIVVSILQIAAMKRNQLVETEKCFFLFTVQRLLKDHIRTLIIITAD